MTETKPYQVLARKYRPETFADLVGQDAMVRVLKNAFAADRIAQAFIMTGIRGTGKTTTARIIAKGMNCTGPDGTGGPTVEPCGQCQNCREIMAGRHVDVMEIDAASNTGVQNVRDTIIETVAYAPTRARYKVYIIDEVHMLSTSAFNALLKTLEEPPPHVKFIFATTEIRKVPVTVLSRCQRFDLRRIEPEVMIGLLRRIASAESGQISDAALALIVRAAEGSARDATSLLDQALSHGAGQVEAEQVRAMLGLADRGRVMDLFDLIMHGDAAGALSELGAQYAEGADPMAVLRDLAELTHWVSVVQITPEAAEDPTVGPDERMRGQTMAQALPMRALTRMWQMLLKALEEVALAPNAMMAAEMAVIRLTHVADLPSPEDLVRRLKDMPRPPAGAAMASAAGTPAAEGRPPVQRGTAGATASGAATARALAPEAGLARFASFAQVLDLIAANRDMALKLDVERFVRLARYAPGRIEFTPAEGAPRDLAARLGQRLQSWTGARWGVSVVADAPTPTIDEDRNAERLRDEAEARDNPLVQAVLAAFPTAKVTVRRAAEAAAAVEALPVVDDEWDPFEED